MREVFHIPKIIAFILGVTRNCAKGARVRCHCNGLYPFMAMTTPRPFQKIGGRRGTFTDRFPIILLTVTFSSHLLFASLTLYDALIAHTNR